MLEGMLDFVELVLLILRKAGVVMMHPNHHTAMVLMSEVEGITTEGGGEIEGAAVMEAIGTVALETTGDTVETTGGTIETRKTVILEMTEAVITEILEAVASEMIEEAAIRIAEVVAMGMIEE